MFLNKFRTVKRNDSKSTNPIDTSQYGSTSGSKDIGETKHVRNVSEKPNFDLFLKDTPVKEKGKEQLSERAINVEEYGSNSTEKKSLVSGSISK